MPPALSTAALGVQQFLATHSCEYRYIIFSGHSSFDTQKKIHGHLRHIEFFELCYMLLFHFGGLWFFLTICQIPKTQTWEQHGWQALPAQQLDLFNRKPGQCKSYIGTMGIMAYLPTFYHKDWPNVGKYIPYMAFRIWMDLFKESILIFDPTHNYNDFWTPFLRYCLTCVPNPCPEKCQFKYGPPIWDTHPQPQLLLWSSTVGDILWPCRSPWAQGLAIGKTSPWQPGLVRERLLGKRAPKRNDFGRGCL